MLAVGEEVLLFRRCLSLLQTVGQILTGPGLWVDVEGDQAGDQGHHAVHQNGRQRIVLVNFHNKGGNNGSQSGATAAQRDWRVPDHRGEELAGPDVDALETHADA